MLKPIAKTFTIVLVTLIAIETVLETPYKDSKAAIRGLVDRSENALTWFEENANVCEPEPIQHLPPGSGVIIGHGYGSPLAPGLSLSVKIEAFLRQNANVLDSVIFSGDVFSDPSKSKWVWLEQISKELGIEVYIAPGNHDVGIGENSRRDIWEETKFSAVSSDLDVIEIAGFSVVLEDSVKTQWRMAPAVTDTLNEVKTGRPLLLVRHNIAVQDMRVLANSQSGAPSALPSLAELSDDLPAGTIVVSGDSGAVSKFPRLACMKQNDVTFLVNGIGDVDGDRVLIISDGEIFQHTLE